jgi:predicted RNA methylase
MLISYPPEKLIRVGGRLLPRLNTDFNSVTSLIQVFIEVFYMVLVCTNTFLKMDYLVICKVVLELWNWVGITKREIGYRESISSSSNIYIFIYKVL